jgi:hypothetical protein
MLSKEQLQFIVACLNADNAAVPARLTRLHVATLDELAEQVEAWDELASVPLTERAPE